MENRFTKKYNMFKNDILRLAFSYTKNMADAEDVTQIVFTKLYKNFDKFTDDDYIKKWLIRVTINECKTLFLSAWKRKIRLLTNKDLKNYAYKPHGDNSVLNAILALPQNDRLIIHLYYYEGYSHHEISKILNIKETTAQTRLFRARKKLKEILQEDWDYEQ